MKQEIKNALHMGNLSEFKELLLKVKKENDEQFMRDLIEAITSEDLNILKLKEKNPDWKFAGYGTNLKADDDHYKYRMDMDDKYVIRYERVPALGSYLSCLNYVNNLRQKLNLSPIGNTFTNSINLINKTLVHNDSVISRIASIQSFDDSKTDSFSTKQSGLKLDFGDTLKGSQLDGYFRRKTPGSNNPKKLNHDITHLLFTPKRFEGFLKIMSEKINIKDKFYYINTM